MNNVLYSKEGCAPCVMIKRYLALKNIGYEEKNALDHIDEIIQLTGQTTVPVFVSGNQVITGYNPAQLAALQATSLG